MALSANCSTKKERHSVAGLLQNIYKMHRFFVIVKGIIDEEFRYWSEHSAYGCSTMPNFYVDEVVDRLHFDAHL